MPLQIELCSSVVSFILLILLLLFFGLLGHVSYERSGVRNGCESGNRGRQLRASRQDLLFLRPALPGAVPELAGVLPDKSPGNTGARPFPGRGPAPFGGPAYRIHVPHASPHRAAGAGRLPDLRHGSGAVDPWRGSGEGNQSRAL